MDKNLIGLLSIPLTVAVTVPYLVNIWKGKIQPHIFTWIIWGVTGGISATAGLAADAGPGAWVQWADALSCLSIAILAGFKVKLNLTRSEILAFVGALSALPVWIATKDPLYAVVIVTSIDTIGYYPTFRKSWAAPYQEALINYVIANPLWLLSVLATETISFTTICFPITIFLMNTLLIFYLLWRRRVVRQGISA